MIDKGLLDSGMDIPFPEARVTIHPPKCKEICLIGQESFYMGCELLNFSKDILNDKDKSNLENISDFDIFMSIINSREKEGLKNKISAKMVLSLIFPDYEILYNDAHNLVLIKNDEKFFINAMNYAAFKQILVELFCLQKDGDVPGQYNTKGDMAKKIADKIRKGREKAAAAKNEGDKEINIIQRYISILSVGLQKSKEELYNYTLYQLVDEYDRYIKKINYDITLQAKMAGTKDIKDADNWME